MPTQIGRIAVPDVSFRTTTGMLVTGSIIKPRILTSCSMVASPKALADILTCQTVRTAAHYLHWKILSQKVRSSRREIYDAIAGGAPGPLSAALVKRVDENFERLAHHFFIALSLNFTLMILQNRKPPGLFFFRNRVRHGHRRRIWPRGILERKNAVVLSFVEQGERFFKVFFRFAREANDKV